MSDIPVDGINDEALTAVGTDARDILTDEAGNSPDFNGDGRVYEMLSLTVTNSHATNKGILTVYDADEGASPSAAKLKLTVEVPAGDSVSLQWDKGSGPQFYTGCVAGVDAGTVAAGAVHSSGLLH